MVHYKKGQHEVFWDDFNVNRSLTSAVLKMHEPRREEIVITFDKPWEGDGCNYYSIVKLPDRYRLYYFGWRMYREDGTAHSPATRTIYVCALEGTDGIHWTRPDYGLYEFEGSTHNNIIMKAWDSEKGALDNFTVFIDENPACPADQKYKATSGVSGVVDGVRFHELLCYCSADGLHWQKSWVISNKNKYDTQNVAFWDKDADEYKLYVRDFHGYSGNWVTNGGIRDIRVQTSKDFKTWTDAKMLDFKGSEDIPLYTNAVRKYGRAEGVYVGFPTRYMERLEWTPNFDQLANPDWRKVRAAALARYGLSVTDCALMVSRDGFSWDRFDEAWIKPGIERKWNWVYGDGYVSVGFVETPSELPFAPSEYSIFCKEKAWSNEAAELRRYTFRMDGLVSRHANYQGGKLVTHPFTFEGEELSINFSTSARGVVVVKAYSRNLEGGNKTDCLTSWELFGDSLDRKVPFKDGSLKDFAGREIWLEFEMKEADLYSMVIA